MKSAHERNHKMPNILFKVPFINGCDNLGYWFIKSFIIHVLNAANTQTLTKAEWNLLPTIPRSQEIAQRIIRTLGNVKQTTMCHMYL